MYKQETKFTKLGVALLTVLAGGLLPTAFAWAAAENPNDNLVQTVTYFPMPYVTYNTIYIGKKLDIGISDDFVAEFGDASCAGKNLLKTTGELPSLWLPGEDASGNTATPTPLILRSHMPDGSNFAGTLNVSGLSAPLYVREVELGQRDRSGSTDPDPSKLKSLHESMGPVSILLPNLAFGTASTSPSVLNSLTVNDDVASNVAVKVKASGSSTSYSVNFPECTEGSANWAQVKFNGSTVTALICGEVEKQPFDTDYTCYNGPRLRCEVNSSNKFYCDLSKCADYFKWNLYSSGSKSLSAAVHKEYCTWVKGGEFSDVEKGKKLIDLMMTKLVSSTWKSFDCGEEAPNTDWNTTEPTVDHCYFVSSAPAPGDVECLEATTENPDPNNTNMSGVTIAYDYYLWEQYSYENTCVKTCESFN